MNDFNAINTNDALSPELEKRARRRAGAKMGWLIHLAVFTVVNAALWMGGVERGWLGLPTGGWIIGLVVHGLAVWFAPARDSFRDGLIEREREAIRRQQG